MLGISHHSASPSTKRIDEGDDRIAAAGNSDEQRNQRARYIRCSGIDTRSHDLAIEFNEVLFGRRSVREYTSQPVDEQTIQRLIEAAIHAPNAVNQQPWTFTVVRDQGLLDRISRDAKTHMLANMPSSDHSDHFRARLGDAKFQIFYHAPVLVLISAVRQGPWMVEDCALAAENLMLAAHAAGFGTCWIGFAQSFLNTPEGKRLLDLRAVTVPIAPIIVGHPKSIPFDVPRKGPDIRWIG